MSKQKIGIFWFRRDLRLDDNHGLHQALQSGLPILPIFIFDPTILEKLVDKYDRRVDYIFQVIEKLNETLKPFGGKIHTFYDNPLEVFKTLETQFDISGIFTNRDYEPQAIERDKEIYHYFTPNNIDFKAFKDQVIFDRNEILKTDGTPYTVFTPYSKIWKKQLTEQNLASFSINLNHNWIHIPQYQNIDWEILQFLKTDMVFSAPYLDATIIDRYDELRNFPSFQSTTRLGLALRFGTISVRQCVQFAIKHNEVWLNELIWREFFMQILYHFPHVVHQSFKSKYDQIIWLNNEQDFEHWCHGTTGYPMVDAGMRELNATGFMHNRVRMVVASFLCKHLLIDWRWGENYFAQKLLDFDLSANNGNWQWASGSGCDSAPYFRIFNPEEQQKKFDKDFTYIKKWMPEFGTNQYPKPIVEHTFARNRALETYKKAVQNIS